MSRIWIDMEDIYLFATGGGRRPTGIQRLAFELCRAINHQHGDADRVRFVRHDRPRGSLATVRWDEVERLFAGLTEPDAPMAATGTRCARGFMRAMARSIVDRLPLELRQPLVRFLKAQVQALAALADVALAVPRLVARRLRRAKSQAAAVTNENFVREVAPGDILFAPGAAFVHPGYAAMVEKLRRQHGMRFALLVYDIIPLRRPEFVDAGHARSFKAWFDATLPLCDWILAISRSAAEEAEAYARGAGIALRDRVRPIPIGTGFTTLAQAPAGPVGAGLPKPGSYVLFVSTIEARKNHLLLVRVWRRLLEQMPDAAVPILVFAGRTGWMVSDLMQQLRNTDFLSGRIRLVDHPSDADLEALYQGCLFTVFPSFYEGWGLPVSESLALGKPCVISNATSLPEVGGTLARYFDPENVVEATSVIRATLEDRAGLAAWQARVVSEYRPVSWDVTAAAAMAAMQPA